MAHVFGLEPLKYPHLMPGVNETRAAMAEKVVREGIKLARTEKTARVGCMGCCDNDNINHPTGGEPRRCAVCPVTARLRGREERT